MAKRKTVLSAARSLLLAVLCLGLLVGTTFAWFSDEAKTGDTKITAGNLDVELYHVKPETVTDHGGVSSGELGEKFGADEQLFDIPESFLWEPGVMWKSEPFAVKNEGTLTLQYTLTVKVEKDPEYTGELDLSERVKMKFAPAPSEDSTPVADTQEARKEYWDDLGEGSASAHGILRPGLNSSAYIAVLYWEPADSTSVDDFEANPDNKFNLGAEEYENGAPSVIFSLDVFATQYPDEEDSFGPDYDAGIVVATSDEEIKSALSSLEDGGEIDIRPSAGNVISSSAFDFSVVPPDVKEFTITGGDPSNKAVVDVEPQAVSDGRLEYGLQFNDSNAKGRTITLSNLKFDGSDLTSGKWGGVVGVSGGNDVNVILENVEVIGTSDPDGNNFNACVSHGGSANLTLRGCYLHGATRGVLAEGHGQVLIEDCTIENRRPLYIDSGDMTFTVKNSRILGGRSAFSASGDGKQSVITFDGVSFEVGSETFLVNNSVVSYCNVTFNNCKFGKNFKYGAQGSTTTVSFNECTSNDEAVTKDNAKKLLYTGIDYQKDHGWTSDENENLTVMVDGTVAKKPTPAA